MNFLKSRTPFLALVIFAACPALAQPSIHVGSNDWRITGYVLTTSPVSLATLVTSGSLTALPPSPNQIVWLCGGDINAASGTSATVTIRDGNGGYFWNGIAPLNPAAASSYNIPFGTVSLNGQPFGGCRPFPAGILVSASAGSVITFSGWGVF